MKIKINKKEYSLDVQKARKSGALQEITPIIHKRGNIYDIKSFGKYILAGNDFNTAVLISLEGDENSKGNRFSDAVIVENVFNISQSEFRKLICGSSWKLVE